MPRTASSCLILAVIVGAVLFLPLGNLAAAAMQPAGCPHCHPSGPGLVSGHACCSPGMPGHCGASGQCGMNPCRCSSGGQALIYAPASGVPTWQVSSHVPAAVLGGSRVFALTIFHPPELSHFSPQI